MQLCERVRKEESAQTGSFEPDIPADADVHDPKVHAQHDCTTGEPDIMVLNGGSSASDPARTPCIPLF